MRSSSIVSTLFASVALAVRPPLPLAPKFGHINAAPESFNSTTFEQYIDHDNPGLGTFSQRYWYNPQYWAGPGSPVVLFTPGEIAADAYIGYLTNRTITGLYAQEIDGAVILLEHRYYGESSPYDSLTVENLQHLTLKNAIADLVHFAQTVKLPFDKHGSSNAPKAAWVLSGGSYSGSLSAWTESTSPGTFWAYHSSSAPVEAIENYYQYFTPVQEGMPQNCSADLNLVIDHIDAILTTGTELDQQQLKELFGLGDIKHGNDFASAIQNGPWLWQSNAFYTGYSSFFKFCDYVENIYATPKANPGPGGVGLEKALAGYADWFKNVFFPGSCAVYGYWTNNTTTDCYDTYNASNPFFTDLSVSNTINRQWNWFLCNEPFFWWQDGAPLSSPTIVSRTVNAAYWERQCALFFPREGKFTYGSAEGKTIAGVNAATGGWFITNSTRLTWTTGQFDPWRTSGMGSEYRPGGPYQGTPKEPINQIPGGFHCSDLILDNAEVNAGVQNVVDIEVNQIKTWVAEFYHK